MSAVTPFPEPPDEGRSQAERDVLASLAALSERVSGLCWIGNAYVNVRGHRRELDVLVLYRGRAFGIEVDGPHHSRHGRYAADRSKDALLEDGGLLFVRRIAVEDTRSADDVLLFLTACFDRLRWWGTAA